MRGLEGSGGDAAAARWPIYQRLPGFDYKCPHCSSLFARKSATVQHCQTVHERRRDHKCPHCSSRFGTAAHMRRDCKTVQEKVQAHARPYCDGVTFGEMSTLNKHKHIDMVHLERRDHACPYCPGVVFGQKSDPKTHIDMVHEKRRDHACPYCPGISYQTKRPEEAHRRQCTSKRTRSARTTPAATAKAWRSGRPAP